MARKESIVDDSAVLVAIGAQQKLGIQAAGRKVIWKGDAYELREPEKNEAG